MAIGPMQLNGILTRTQDFTVIKQNEDMKPMTDQAMFQNTMEKAVEKKLTQVKESEDTDTYQRKQDAKEKGKNEYQGDGGQNRRRSNSEFSADGKVIRKGSQGFDCSI
ncbi:MAG: hypothetical protein E7289_08125 [Lachnospiraceae bacterium]|nr:hypothetical protein [Lachnospiraceae bacterium]